MNEFQFIITLHSIEIGILLFIAIFKILERD